MLRNMACSLIEHKRIKTTVAKAKALRTFVEPLITRSKTDEMHSRRMVFRSLHSKHAVSELFREVAPKVGDRQGGYTRIIKLGNRIGDNAEMCYIELVDFNELMLSDSKPAKKSRRSRRGGGKGGAKPAAAPVAEATEAATEATPEDAKEDVTEAAAAAEVVAETAEATEEVAEETTEEKAPAAEPEATTEESTEEDSKSEEE